jgi:hypothetical protein
MAYPKHFGKISLRAAKAFAEFFYARANLPLAFVHLAASIWHSLILAKKSSKTILLTSCGICGKYNAMAFASLKTVETDTLRYWMIRRALTVETLAENCGVKRITLSNQIAKNFPSRRLRLIVEGVLMLPLWSSEAAFKARQCLASRCYFDPFVFTTSQLQQRCSTLKIRGRSKDKRKASLIALIEGHFNNTNQQTQHEDHRKNKETPGGTRQTYRRETAP